MKATGDTEAINLSTGERWQRVTGDGESLLRLIDEYATARVSVALEHTKDPWTSYGMGCIERAEKYETTANQLLDQIKEELHALSKRT